LHNLLNALDHHVAPPPAPPSCPSTPGGWSSLAPTTRQCAARHAAGICVSCELSRASASSLLRCQAPCHFSTGAPCALHAISWPLERGGKRRSAQEAEEERAPLSSPQAGHSQYYRRPGLFAMRATTLAPPTPRRHASSSRGQQRASASLRAGC